MFVSFALAFLLAFTLAPTSAEAIWVNLTTEQINEALAHGKSSFDRFKTDGRPLDDLDPEYVVDLGGDTGRAMLFTEFSAVALEGRRFQAIGQPLAPADVGRILGPLRGRIQISVIVSGPSADYLRQHTVRLEQRTGSHAPVRWDVFRGTLTAGGERRYTAPGYYTFDADKLDPTAPAVLLLRDQNGHEIRFTFDFGKLR